METSKEPICVRTARLNSQLTKKSTNDHKLELITRDALLDAFTVLYDECSANYLKITDANAASFTDRFRPPMDELRHLRPNLHDFHIGPLIGRGNWGEVRIARELQTNDVYALKSMRKADYLQRGSATFRIERELMASGGDSVWLTKLQYAFQDCNSLHFVMEYHPGGDLAELLVRQGGAIPESAATFYLAELFMAVNDVHALGYVHRDIKPENILLDRCGHLKLADFGSAAKLCGKSGRVEDEMPVGTPEYIAPEVLQSINGRNNKKIDYGIECDYWSIGIVGYQLTVGARPFTGPTTSAIYSKIMAHTHLKFPPEIALTQAYVSLIHDLLTDQRRRLTHAHILKHALFANTDFAGLLAQVPPFVPTVNAPDDTTNFSHIAVKQPAPHIDNFKTQTKFSGKNLPFIGFGFMPEVVAGEEEAAARASASTTVKDEEVEELRREIRALQRRAMKEEDAAKSRDAIERKLEEKCRKLEAVEGLHGQLERDLANTIAECTKMKRTLELERKDRIDLEYKALDLIKGAKMKWEASEKKKVDALMVEMNEQRDKLDALTNENATLRNQLANATRAEDKQKISLDKIEKLSRHSIVSLESRLERVTSDTQQQLHELQAKLHDELQCKAAMESEIKLLQKRGKQLKADLEASEISLECAQKKLKQTESDAHDLNAELKGARKENARSEKIIGELKSKLELASNEIAQFEAIARELTEMKDGRKQLQQQIQKLEADQSQLIVAHQQELIKQTHQHQEHLKEERTKLEQINEVKERLERELADAQRSDLDNKLRVVKLEELVKRLESGVTKLENDYEKDNVLKEQVERLEQQLIQVHESFALEKQELTQLKTKFWRMEKDLNNAEIDKRIFKRETKEAETTIQKLEGELTKVRAQIDTNKTMYETAIIELNNLNEELAGEVSKLKGQSHALDEQLTHERELRAKEARAVEQYRTTAHGKETEIVAIGKEMDVLRCEKMELKRKLDNCQEETGRLHEQLRQIEKSKQQIADEFNDCKRDLQNTQLNLKALREACTLLEHQLEEYEKIQDADAEKQQQQAAQTDQLRAELEASKHELQCARRELNEERSLRHLAETKGQRLHEDVECVQNEATSYKRQCVELREYSSSLADELASVEEKMADIALQLKGRERDVANLLADANALKEEKTMQLTHLNEVKESNYQLRQQLNDYQRSNAGLMQQIEQLQNILAEKINYHKDRELKAEATIQQQTKLIDFLQSKVEEAKKKKTFADMIFGHSKKENQPPTATPLNYKELETLYAKEKTINRELRKEIERMRGKQSKGSVSPRTQVAHQHLSGSGPLQTHVQRDNSQRMRHNIPHRFESKLCTKLTKCAHCANQIVMGRMMSTCTECRMHAHNHCARALPKTCGLPKEYAKHYTESMRKCETTTTSNGAQNETARDQADVHVEGWVKIPIKGCWERLYACLTPSAINIYAQPPNNDPSVRAVQSFELHPPDSHGKVVLEPVAAEMDVPVARSDLAFIVKVVVSPNTTCWPPKVLVMMTLSVEEKDKWFKGLRALYHTDEKYKGRTLLRHDQSLHVNQALLLDDEGTVCLLATDRGLYTHHHDQLVHIAGPTHVQHVQLLPALNLAALIVDVHAHLITCDLQHLLALAQCAACAQPTLTFHAIDVVNNMTGFHALYASAPRHDRERTILCAATLKQLVILGCERGAEGGGGGGGARASFRTLRVLDTAEPTACCLFTKHSVIVGVDKLFEIDLATFRAEEFLDLSDRRLRHTHSCLPLAIFKMAAKAGGGSKEFLVCFGEFATFVDEFGRSTREYEVKWSRLPKAFHYHAPYLYVVQFASVEIIEVGGAECATPMVKVEYARVGFLGGAAAARGILLECGDEVQLMVGGGGDDGNEGVELEGSEMNEGEETEEEEEEFSFTSSMVHSLEGGSVVAGEELGEGRKMVKFSPSA